MPYNPHIHHRRSIRLKGYDYSQAGMYFVTICVQNREYLFGKITDGEMTLNDAGKMIKKWCMELPHKFPDILLDTYIIMPNHFHVIIVNIGGGNGDDNDGNGDNGGDGDDNGDNGGDVGAHLCVRPCEHESRGESRGGHESRGESQGEHESRGESQGEHAGSPLHRVVQWFKTMTTNEYIRGVKTSGWQPFDKKLWQRNYYEHIIRNEKSYQHISDYIINNPQKWREDKFYME
ncbi:MAG: transposase [Tannerella sp.]|jgi:REP element-mobilizing transposase RayT|nr:transposase [Tannerella sp.]